MQRQYIISIINLIRAAYGTCSNNHCRQSNALQQLVMIIIDYHGWFPVTRTEYLQEKGAIRNYQNNDTCAFYWLKMNFNTSKSK